MGAYSKGGLFEGGANSRIYGNRMKIKADFWLILWMIVRKMLKTATVQKCGLWSGNREHFKMTTVQHLSERCDLALVLSVQSWVETATSHCKSFLLLIV